jgi:1-acyl-sn-glycerol-3-phosphate acyltransferase
MATKRCVHFLAKDDLMKPPLKYLFDKLGIIPVNRRSKDKHALSSAIEVLKDDKVIGIFPEGKVKTKNECIKNVILPFKYGAVKMAQITGSKIVPFSITGKYKLFRKKIEIEFFEPIEITEDLSESNGRLMSVVEKGILSSEKFVYKEYHGNKS